MINNLFWGFEFPLNLLAPISGGVLGVLITNLVYKILEFIQSFFYFDILDKILSYDIYPLVFFITIIIGYLVIINEENRERKTHPWIKEEIRKKEMKETKMPGEFKEKKKPSDSYLTWEDVENEFRKVSLNIGKALNQLFEGKNKKRNPKGVSNY